MEPRRPAQIVEVLLALAGIETNNPKAFGRFEQGRGLWTPARVELYRQRVRLVEGRLVGVSPTRCKEVGARYVRREGV